MRPTDTQDLEEQAWHDFLSRLGEHLAGQWPALQVRLGDRYAAFIELAVQQAGQCGLCQAVNVARYVNLWFVWGAAFHDKPGFEWARAILSASRQREWLSIHQLVQRSRAELQRLPGSRIEPQLLASVDARLIDIFGPLGRRGAMHRPAPAPVPRVACDLEAVELRLLDGSACQQYRLEAGDWRRVPVDPPAALRIQAAQAIPPRVGVLAHPPGQGPATYLQLRARSHAVCGGDAHPALGFLGPHGRWDWAGRETRAVSWPVTARDPALFSDADAGFAIAEETSPELYQITLDVCGLRDEGEPVGSLQTQLSAWPATQWWLEIQRAQPVVQALLPGPHDWARAPTRCRVERDGTPQDAAPLRQQFEDGLDAAVAAGLQRLAATWTQLPGLGSARFDALLGLLVGAASVTWGWQWGPGGLAGAALMRVLASIEMEGCQADLQLGGELDLAGTRSRVTLRTAGQSAWRQTLQRETADVPLFDVMLPAVARWRFPFELSLEPVANEAGCLLQQAGPLSGALVGEAGLRPGTRGRSGWEWFVGLRLEPVIAALQVTDPLLGNRALTQPLLPALTLVDWSLG